MKPRKTHTINIHEDDVIPFFKWYDKPSVRKQMNDDLGYVITTVNSYYGIKENYKLFVTTKRDDIWLIHNCPIPFIKDAMINNYGNDYYDLINGIDPQYRFYDAFIMSIKNDVDAIYFYKSKNVKEQGTILYYLENILVYGSTHFHDIVESSKKSFETIIKPFDYDILINYYGIFIERKINGGIINHNTDAYSLEIQKEGIEYEEFKTPRIKHSFDERDSLGYVSENIYTSSSKEIISLYEYKDYEQKRLRRYLQLGVSDHITKLIKQYFKFN